nr:CopD family protein [Granulicella sp. dw_53]
MSGSTGFAENLALAPTILSSTHQGTLWYLNSLGLAILLVTVLLGRKPVAIWSAIGALCLIAFAKAASGHAADQGDFTLTELTQLLHILATAVWAGSVLISGLIILPRLARHAGIATLWTYGNRLSQTVTWALIVLVLSGIYTSDRELNNSLPALWTSTWGKILLIKVAFVLAALSLGATSRLFCLQRPATGRRTTLLLRLILAEAIVMVFILCLSGLLANTAPPMANM